jgi:hypothetical protein
LTTSLSTPNSRFFNPDGWDATCAALAKANFPKTREAARRAARASGKPEAVTFKVNRLRSLYRIRKAKVATAKVTDAQIEAQKVVNSRLAELLGCTVATLRNMARGKVKGFSKLRKADLVNALLPLV